MTLTRSLRRKRFARRSSQMSWLVQPTGESDSRNSQRCKEWLVNLMHNPDRTKICNQRLYHSKGLINATEWKQSPTKDIEKRWKPFQSRKMKLTQVCSTVAWLSAPSNITRSPSSKLHRSNCLTVRRKREKQNQVHRSCSTSRNLIRRRDLTVAHLWLGKSLKLQTKLWLNSRPKLQTSTLPSQSQKSSLKVHSQAHRKIHNEAR